MANCQMVKIDISNSLWDGRIENSFHKHMSKSFQSLVIDSFVVLNMTGPYHNMTMVTVNATAYSK